MVSQVYHSKERIAIASLLCLNSRMEVVADLHLHSKYSRAVSKDMILPEMARVGRQKGLQLLSACDFTHPLWFKEISNQLEEAEEGIYQLKSTSEKSKVDSEREPVFLLATEIASIYTQGGRLRRIHNLVFAPSLEIAEKISKELIRRGCNLMADGRPIIGISSKNLLSLLLEIDERIFLIPCHIWTPHFGLYGSASGFESIEESFEELSKYIYGIETGLSSDPEMNWRIKELEHRSILSFSDAHSLPKMGREATVFVRKDGISNDKFQISNFKYEDIRLAIMRKSDTWKIGYTIEFYPEEGKYHFSGHRNCGISIDPTKVKEEGNMCPVCKRRLTEGVLYRVEQLADRKTEDFLVEKENNYGLKWFTDKTHHHPPYVKLVPLLEIIAESLESTVFSQKAKQVFSLLCEAFGSEIEVLLKTPIIEITKVAGEKVAEGIDRVRKGSIAIEPGFDGEYGKVAIWTEEKKDEKEEPPQMSLL